MSGGERLPVKARLNLLAPGPEFYFASGLRLDLASTGAPYLSWADGSAGADIPTPDVPWVLVSFKNSQPPVLLVFLDGPASLTLSGRPGDWHLQSSQGKLGWVRAVLPFGTEGLSAGGASALGEQTARLQKNISAWVRPGASPTSFAVKGDGTSVTASWAFDREGAMVPSAALLAPKGGYKLEIQSKLQLLDGSIAEGPRAILTEKRLSIRFPAKAILPGRALGLHAPAFEPPGTISPVDMQSVAELALGGMLACRETAAAKMISDTIAAFVASADYYTEPLTNQSLPYNGAGQGLDTSAAQALLMVAGSQSSSSSEQNSLLTSLAWCRDWSTWTFLSAQERAGRRASALAAIAGAMCPEPYRRLDGALLEAGLAAQRARDAGLGDKSLERIEPLSDVRAAVYGDLLATSRSAEYLLSPLRTTFDQPLRVERSPKGLLLSWNAIDLKPTTITLYSSTRLTFQNVNLVGLKVTALGPAYKLEVTPASIDAAMVKIILPEGSPPLPAGVAPPPYSEPLMKANPH